MSACLEFDSVDFKYTQDPVLKSLTFSVTPGEIVAFLGVNGAGKTTTFLLASGLLRPEKGKVLIDGVVPSEEKTWCHSVGVMMSGAGLYPRLTVRRNLAFFAELYGQKADLDAHLEIHGLSEFKDKPAGHLSQGYRRRLALARATVHQPSLLLLDEPADGLDPAGSEYLHQYLDAFRKEGGAVFLTSHRIEEVERLCDRVLLLNEGQIAVDSLLVDLSSEKSQSLREILLEMGR